MPASNRVSTAHMRWLEFVPSAFVRSTLILPIFVLPILVLSISVLPSAAAPPSDQAAAERVLGPQWKQLSRRAGMIFTGTVLAAPDQTESSSTDRPLPGPIPVVQLRLHVDRAIAGVEPGQILSIHEWAGAWSMHRPMRRGQRFLLFLYPPSRLGLTSPVGGSLGQVELDVSGYNVVDRFPDVVPLTNVSPPRPIMPAPSGNIGVVQLERAIRQAREVRSDSPTDSPSAVPTTVVPTKE